MNRGWCIPNELTTEDLAKFQFNRSLNVSHIFTGCGFNVSNSNPTICINDIIQQHNQENGTNLQTFSIEELLGSVISTMETLINDFQKNGCEPFCDLYYKYWLHR